ncbi:unnamed protein product [Meloidogyne enterolobii]|uniref:Uncharacterized protein n=1 Tax=Meloidogyne enterolobii TaxID=390850 RepID=A0ACB0XYT9_MELEN
MRDRIKSKGPKRKRKGQKTQLCGRRKAGESRVGDLLFGIGIIKIGIGIPKNWYYRPIPANSRRKPIPYT